MTDTLCLERQKLRKSFLSARNTLSPADRTAMSGQIIKTLIALPVFNEKNKIFIYCSYLSEVATFPLLSHCLAAGKTVFVPLIVPESIELQAIAITDPSTELLSGFKGIPEPVPSVARGQKGSPQDLEIVIVPGAVFDHTGHRLGYGGGYYDRFLAQKAPQAYRIGLAYSRQLTPKIPVLSHDVPMDMVVTEKDILAWPRSRDA